MPRSLEFQQFRESLKRGSIEPVYLFDGEEDYFHEEGIRLLERAVLPDGAAAVDRESVLGSETGLATVLDLASTYPMGGGRRLVIVRRADGMRLEEAGALSSFLLRPNPRACLVFSDSGFDRRRLLYRTLLAGATRVDCRPLDEARSIAWVRERLRGRGYAIGTDLAEAIATGLAGAALGRLDSELQKLMDAIGEPRPIQPADLAILADVPRVEDAFRLAAQVARGDRAGAIAALRALLEAGEEPVRLLGALAWYFRNALKAEVASRRRLPPREITDLYGINQGRIERFREETGHAGTPGLQSALALCLQADRELKGLGAKDPAHAFERLIHRAGRTFRRTV
jgi:DNA polymerase-3 subunit delta